MLRGWKWLGSSTTSTYQQGSDYCHYRSTILSLLLQQLPPNYSLVNCFWNWYTALCVLYVCCEDPLYKIHHCQKRSSNHMEVGFVKQKKQKKARDPSGDSMSLASAFHQPCVSLMSALHQPVSVACLPFLTEQHRWPKRFLINWSRRDWKQC